MLASLESLGDRLVAVASRPVTFAVFVAVMCTGASVMFRVPDPDLFARIAVGNLVLAHGGLPRHDPFAYTPAKPV